jgi:hypothetical protein
MYVANSQAILQNSEGHDFIQIIYELEGCRQ